MALDSRDGAAVGQGTPFGLADPLYVSPYVDVDEWRDDPVRHRYVHGGFTGTELRFSFYLPPKELYEGRFFQPLMAVSGTEHAATMPPMMGAMIGHMIPFAFESGAFLVESNQGRTVMYPGDDPTIPGYRGSAAAAGYARVLAAEMYGRHRAYGYVFGGSGGAYKTIACFENALGVWDGAVPFVPGSPLSMPNVFTVQAHAIRILKDKFDQIVDVRRPEPRGAGGAGRGHPDGLSAASLVQPRAGRHRLHRRVRRSDRQHRELGSGVLRPLLEGARIFGLRRATLADRGAAAA
jgi:hypothetical protein